MKGSGSKRRIGFFGAIAAITLLLVLVSTAWISSKSPESGCLQASPGMLDLSGCNEQEFPVKLNGEWEIYWNQLLEPADWNNGEHPPEPSYMHVPKQWLPGLQGPEGGSGQGAATYRLKLLLPVEPRYYGIKVNNVRTSSRLYLDGELIGASGAPGLDRSSTEAQNKPYEVFFRHEGKEAELVLQAANFSFISGGISETVYFGDAQSIRQLASRNRSYDLGFTVCLTVISIFFFAQSLQRNRDRASFFLALFCLCAAFYLMTHSEKLLYEYIPGISYAWFSKLQGLSAVIGYWGLAGYTYYIISYTHNRLVFQVSGLIAGVSTVIILVLDTPGYAFLTYPVTVEALVVCGYVIYVMIRGIAKRIQGSLYLMIGMIGVVYFIAAQLLNLIGEVDVYAGPPFAIPLFALAQSLFLSSRYNDAFRTIHRLSHELKRKDRDKDEFLFNTSHELRKPLEAITSISRSMTETPAGLKLMDYRENLLVIMSSSRRLSLLVNDLIDYERIVNGTMEISLKETDVYPAADMVLEIFRRLNPRESMILHNEIEPGVCMVMADESRLTQILYSLADAAYRQAEEGMLRIYAQQSDGNCVTLVVEYKGRVLPAERLKAAFGIGGGRSPDERILDSDFDESTMGLKIAAQLARLQHAALRFVQDGAVNRFCADFSGEIVRKPMRYGETVPLPARMQQVVFQDDAFWEGGRHAVEEEPYQVLLVDDDYVHVKTLANVLLAQGCKVVSAPSGEETMRLLREGHIFDLCVVNVKLPDMSGLSLCALIRQDYGLLDLPVLLSTPRSYAGMHEAGAAAGANDFIYKPYEWEEVKARIRTLTQLRRMVSRLLDSEIAMLRAQIKPHFLYNAINTIIWMSKRDMEQCRQLLRDLSEFLRGSFDFANRESLVTFSDEMKLIQAYLSLEQARFGERLEVVYAVGNADFLLPPLMVQPIVENAVRHGITQLEDGGKVTIAVTQVADDWVITVTDDGAGMSEQEMAACINGTRIPDRTKGTGIGLANINRRLIRQFGRSLEIEPRPGGGTVVTIRLPRLSPLTRRSPDEA